MVCIFPTLLSGQSELVYSVDSISRAELRYAVNQYSINLGYNSPLYNGKEENTHVKYKEGHAYYQSSDKVMGSIVYDHVLFENKLMRFDLIHRELTILPKEGMRSMALYADKIQSFTIGGDVFCKLSTKEGAPYDDFFKKLAEGKGIYYQYIYKKIVETKDSDGRAEYKVKERKEDFVSKEGVFYRVRSKSDIYKLFPQSKELLGQKGENYPKGSTTMEELIKGEIEVSNGY